MKKEIKEKIIDFAINEAPIFIILIDSNRKILDTNEYVTKVLGNDIIGKSICELFLDFDNSLSIDEMLQKTPKDYKINLNTTDGLPTTFELSFFSIKEKTLVLAKPDVKELENLRSKMVSLNNKLANMSRRLQKKNSELIEKREALDSAINGVAITNLKGKITYVNPSFLKILGYEEEEVLGSDVYNFVPKKEEETLKNIRKIIKEKGGWRGELEIEEKNGEVFPIQLSTSIIEDKNRNPIGMLGSFIDIREKKRSQKRENLLHSLLRHDVQNKNQIIEGYLKLLKEKPEEMEKYIDKALKATKESKEIIEKVRTLKEVQQEEISEIKINSIIEEVVRENRSQAKEKNIKVINTISDLNCLVKAGSLLKELFNNLITNSIKHSGGNKIKIRAKEEGEKVILSFEDDGKGIHDEIKNRVFERGYKHGGTGETGLGLYLAKEITQNYGGRIETKDSELGGARFDVYLQKP